MEYTINDLIKLYGDEVISPKSVSKTGGIRNKQRVVNKLETMFEYVNVTGRGRNVVFEVDKPKSYTYIDKRRRNISSIQELLVNNTINVLKHEDIKGIKLTPKLWLEKFGIVLLYRNIHNLENKVRDTISFDEMNYMTKWFPDIKNYEQPNIDKVVCDNAVLTEIDDLLNRWYSEQFKALSHKLERYGVIFQEQILCVKDGVVAPLPPKIKKELAELEQGNKNKKLFRRSSKYKDYLKDKNISIVYTAYTCNITSDLDKIPTETIENTKDEIFKAQLETLQKVFIRKEIGKYEGLFGDGTYIPYEAKLDRLLRVEDFELLEYIKGVNLGKSLISKLIRDYDLYTQKRTDPIIYKLKYSRMLYKVFAKVVEISNGIELDNTLYDEAIKEWNKNYKEDLQNNNYSNMNLEVILG